LIDTTGQGNYSYQPRGKQSLTPGGIFYTSSSGIWQTPDIDHQTVNVTVQSGGTTAAHPPRESSQPIPPGNPVRIEVLDSAAKTVATGNGTVNSAGCFALRNARLWSPGDPYLYGLRISYGSDAVTSYFGMRKVEIREDANGYQRIFVNTNLSSCLARWIKAFGRTESISLQPMLRSVLISNTRR
jgi:hypothetical protein